MNNSFFFIYFIGRPCDKQSKIIRSTKPKNDNYVQITNTLLLYFIYDECRSIFVLCKKHVLCHNKISLAVRSRPVQIGKH